MRDLPLPPKPGFLPKLCELILHWVRWSAQSRIRTVINNDVRAEHSSMFFSFAIVSTRHLVLTSA